MPYKKDTGLPNRGFVSERLSKKQRKIERERYEKEEKALREVS